MAGKQVQEPPRTAVVRDVTTSSAVWRDEKRGRDVPVKLYRPAVPSPAPVVLFSHGIGEDRDSYAYVGKALAEAGFLAVHITHAGTDRAVLERGYLHLYRAVSGWRRSSPFENVSWFTPSIVTR